MNNNSSKINLKEYNLKEFNGSGLGLGDSDFEIIDK